MRILVFFDLPTITSADKREYQTFRKHLIKSGFLMQQESVYSKIALNSTTANAVIESIRKHKPAAGLVQLLTVTERQFERMEFIIGENKSETLNSDERLVIL